MEVGHLTVPDPADREGGNPTCTTPCTLPLNDPTTGGLYRRDMKEGVVVTGGQGRDRLLSQSRVGEQS